MKQIWLEYKWLILVICCAVLLVFAPFLLTYFSTGVWQKISVTYGDEFIYYSHLKEIGTGNILFGNPYYLEHRFDPQIALFGSSILAAIPLFFGLSLSATLVFNFVIWGVALVIILYWLARRMGLPQIWAAAATLFVYLQSYDLIFRVSVRQQIFPFFFLFYIALLLFLGKPNKQHFWGLAITTGITFWIYGFLWQLTGLTIGVLVLYSAFAKKWQLTKTAISAGILGLIIGLPPFVYSLWITTVPHFWESMNRFGLIQSRMPQAEILYSGFWVVLVLAIVFVYKREQRESLNLQPVTVFIYISGIGLLLAEVSNILTGQNFEVGEHIRRFIIPWLGLVSVFVLYLIRRSRSVLLWSAMTLLIAGNIWFLYVDALRFNPTPANRELWSEEQLYAKPLAWLNARESQPVVVWANPHNPLVAYIPAFTKHYVLHEEFGQFNLMSNTDFYERYLVSQYFDRPTVETLKADMVTFAGRGKTFHEAKNLERKIKVCRLFMFWNPAQCGEVKTSTELFGEENFQQLQQKFNLDIQPHILQYVKKYHVRYIIKDTVRDVWYRPEQLGAKRVYSDGRFEIYRL